MTQEPPQFEQLYSEGATRCRMMVIGLHERLSGHSSRVRVLDRILSRLPDRDDVWQACKDQLAQWTWTTQTPNLG